jgi:hypothetical protein
MREEVTLMPGTTDTPVKPAPTSPSSNGSGILTWFRAEWVKAEAYAVGYTRKEAARSKWRSVLLWTSTAFSAAVGTAVFVSLGTSVDPLAKVIVACVSLAAAILTAWNKLAEPGAEIGKCRTAHLAYAEIRDKAATAYCDLRDGKITSDAGRKIRDELLASGATIRKGDPPVLSSEEWAEAEAAAKERVPDTLGSAL